MEEKRQSQVTSDTNYQLRGLNACRRPAPRHVKLVCPHQLCGHWATPEGWKQLRVLWCKPKENTI